MVIGRCRVTLRPVTSRFRWGDRSAAIPRALSPTACAVIVAGGAWWTACADDAGGCDDPDLDGFGSGCELGPDCDDTNPVRNVDCDAVPPPDCTSDPFAPGCPCLPGAFADCYSGPEETQGVGVCLPGRARCVSRHWSICEGERAPLTEFCDEADNDCDGLVDEEVQSPCGDCTPGCDGAVWGNTERPFVVEGDLVAEDDWLTLAWAPTSVRSNVWVANSGEATVSKIDAAAPVEGGPVSVGVDLSRVGSRSTTRVIFGWRTESSTGFRR